MLVGGKEEIVYWRMVFEQACTIFADGAVRNCAICGYVDIRCQNRNDEMDC